MDDVHEYSLNKGYGSSQLSKVSVNNVNFTESQLVDYVEEDDVEAEDEDEEEAETNVDDNELNETMQNGGNDDYGGGDQYDEDGNDDDDDVDDDDDDANLQRHPKKRKLKSLLSSYEFAPQVPPPISARKPSFGGRNTLTDWSEHETFVLLDAWGERYLKCNRKSLRSDEWLEVADRVSQESKIERTDSQCRNRLDTLKKKYKKEKASLNASRNRNTKWVYFKKMDMLLSGGNVATSSKSNGIEESRGTSGNSHSQNDVNDDDDEEDDDDDDDDDDDTSSGSSSPLKDNFYSQNVDRLGPLASRYPTHNDLKGVNGRTGPSGYLKVKGQVENAAITAVKRQLGRNYIEDGPALGIEFEPLPPGAFENPVNTPVNHSYYVGDSTALHQLDGSRTFQLPYGNKMHEPYNPKSYDPVEFNEPTGLETRYSSKHSEKSQHKSTHPISKYADNQFESKLKHGPGVIRRPDSSFNHHLIGHEKNFHGKQAENYMRSGPSKVSYRDRVDPLTSDFAYKRGEVLQREDKGLSRKAPKVKRSRDEFMHQVYPRNEVAVDLPPITNKITRPMAPMTASFSDDESAETASSGD